MKLVFFDIDGTLWDGKLQIPDSTRQAIKKLRANGHKAFICSGRARSNIISKELLSIGFDGILAACGNHVEMDGQVLYQKLLPDSLVERVVKLVEECHMPVVLEGPKDHWFSKKGFEKDAFITSLFHELGEHSHVLEGYSKELVINKFSADVIPATDYDRIKAELAQDFTILEHTEEVVEFVPKGSSKATGIAWLCDYLQVPVEDTYALGDSVNDLDMLKFVGHGIAMGNGSQPAKEAAEYVTAELHQDGIYKALEHYGLI